uniref:Polyprotein protein n=1 Tax=Solanum tuberosum TaxID=4113 RepID=M1DBB3_SOLTU
MGNLAHSAYVRVSRVEVVVPSMMKRAIATALAPIWKELREQRELITPHGLALDALTARVKGIVDFHEEPSSELPLVPVDSEIPLANVIGDVATTDEDREFDTPDTDEKDLVAHDIDVYEDLEGDILWATTETSLRDTSLIGSS